MRRLYSTFADGWPGVGLLLMRVISGLVLAVNAATRLSGNTSVMSMMACVAMFGLALLVMAGLWTPFSGTVVAVVELAQLTADGDPLAAVLMSTIGAALAMLGPGRWSMDARLFGWKRVESPPLGALRSPTE